MSEVRSAYAQADVLWEMHAFLASLPDSSAMNPYPLNRSSSRHVWISIGAGLFLVALAVSALAVPQLRLPHLLQALIYVAVVILAHRDILRLFYGLGRVAE
jgi:hypothetical protein